MLVRGGGGGTYWPGQFDHARVNTYINTGGGVQQGTFRVDMDQIPGLIAKYEEARDKLQSTLRKAQDLEQFSKLGAPGNDEVSRQMAQALGRMASNEDGCLSRAVNDGIDRLGHQITQLEAARDAYEGAEDTATARTL